MLSFYPGPSELRPEVAHYMQEAVASGVLTANHRSQPFMELMQQAVKEIRRTLAIPSTYQVYFTSSATECWEIIAQSYASLPSLHLYNGAFGKKWLTVRKSLGHEHATAHPFSEHRMLGHQRVSLPFDRGMLCLTHTETSNGTQVRSRIIGKLKKRLPQALVCVDATSSMGGVALEWKSADIWYASVQKCFGLPSGLAVMVCSPKAIQWAKEQSEDSHYNSLLRIEANAQKWQTTHTPNILGIYLLKRAMQDSAPIKQVSNHVKQRAQLIRKALDKAGFELLIGQERVMADTVIAVKYPEGDLPQLKEEAARAGFTLGNGYGKWKPNTFRIANFPAIPDRGVHQLLSFLRKYNMGLHL